MTDMRATERLLEVISEHERQVVELIDFDALPRRHSAGIALALDGIEKAITELRRRGDTLVRAADLAIAIDVARHGPAILDDGTQTFAIRRLENALGGKMR